MEKQNHFFDELIVIFSQERLDGYLRHTHCNNSRDEALITYSWNIKLSQALYPALQILEIALRNSLHVILTETHQTTQWFDLPFFLRPKEKNQITQAKDSLQKENKPAEPGRIVAELSFGFWTSLFDVRYEHDQILWPQLLKPAFPFLPKGQRTRNYLSRELNRIRQLRNRVFHYEPIWHWKDLPQQHTSIKNLISGLHQPASRYLTLLDQFEEVHANGRKIIEGSINNIFYQQGNHR